MALEMRAASGGPGGGRRRNRARREGETARKMWKGSGKRKTQKTSKILKLLQIDSRVSILHPVWRIKLHSQLTSDLETSSVR